MFEISLARGFKLAADRERDHRLAGRQAVTSRLSRGSPPPFARQIAEYLRMTSVPHSTAPACRCPSSDCRPITQCRIIQPTAVSAVDHPLFREQSYHALSRRDAARRADLGTYRA